MSSLFGNMGNKGGQPVANTPNFQTGPQGWVQGPFSQPDMTYSGVSPGAFPTAPGSAQAPDFSSQLSRFNVPSKGGDPIGGDTSSGLTASLSGGNVATGGGGGGGWNSVTGTEFGEVDNPKYGGYTEPNWDKGAWGDDLTGWGTKGIALPHVPHGTVVEVMNPANGKTIVTTVKDRGPGPKTGAGIDLLGGVVSDLGLPRNSSYPIRYRIVGPPGTPIPGATGASAQVALQQRTGPGAQLGAQLSAQGGQQQGRQPQKKHTGTKQSRKPPPHIRRTGHIAYNAQAPPAELQFLRQSLGSLPYSETTPAQEQSSEEA